jgi:hypothetical protein
MAGIPDSTYQGSTPGAPVPPILPPQHGFLLVVTEDKMIPPPAQRFMSKRAGSTVVEVAGSHAIYVSQPNAVAMLIDSAAKGVKKKIT